MSILTCIVNKSYRLIFQNHIIKKVDNQLITFIYLLNFIYNSFLSLQFGSGFNSILDQLRLNQCPTKMIIREGKRKT